jgi:hypothetical protein
VLGLAWVDQARRRRWIVGVDQPDLRRLMVGGVEEQEAPALRLAQAEEKSGVGLLMNEGILPVRSDGM